MSSDQFFSSKWEGEVYGSGRWSYYDYMYLRDLFPPPLLARFPWDVVGLQGRDGADATLWIGTKGAHTPCHQVRKLH